MFTCWFVHEDSFEISDFVCGLALPHTLPHLPGDLRAISRIMRLLITVINAVIGHVTHAVLPEMTAVGST